MNLKRKIALLLITTLMVTQSLVNVSAAAVDAAGVQEDVLSEGTAEATGDEASTTEVSADESDQAEEPADEELTEEASSSDEVSDQDAVADESGTFSNEKEVFNSNTVDASVTGIKFTVSDGRALAKFDLKYDSKNTGKWTSTYVKYYVILYAGGINEKVKAILLNDPRVTYSLDKTAAKYHVTADLSEFVSDHGSDVYRFRVYEGSGKYSEYSVDASYDAPSDSLPVPGNIQWVNQYAGFDGHVKWDTVSGASAYVAELYKDDEIVNTVVTSGSSCMLVKNATAVSPETGLKYTFRVRAISRDIDAKRCSEFSDRSVPLARKLDSPTRVSWNGFRAEWSRVNKAQAYTVVLRKNGNAVSGWTVQVSANYCYYNFADYLDPATVEDKQKGVGNKYTFTVTAVPASTPTLLRSDTVSSGLFDYKDRAEIVNWNMTSTGNIEILVNSTDANYCLKVEYLGVNSKDIKKPRLVYDRNWGHFPTWTEDGRGLFTFDAFNLLTKPGDYRVTVSDKRSKFKVSRTFTYTGDNLIKLNTPVVRLASATRISWGEVPNARYYEIKLFKGSDVDSKDATNIKVERLDYNLLNDVLRTGYDKCAVRAIPENIGTYRASNWSKEYKIKPTTTKISLSGNCGAQDGNATFRLSGTKGNLTLTIYGTGAMRDYSNPSLASTYEGDSPIWYDYASHIKKITISDGITKIGSYSFYGLPNITAVKMPKSLKQIGEAAFRKCAGLKEKIVFPAGLDHIGDYAFLNTALTTVQFNGGAPNLGPLVFPNGVKNSYASFPKTITIQYSTRTSGWDGISKNKWKGYKVKKLPIPVTGVEIKDKETGVLAKSLTMQKTKRHYLAANVLPTDADKQSLKWTSSNTKVAIVYKTGEVVAVGPGLATITVTSTANDKAKATCSIAVYSKKGWNKSGSSVYYIDDSGERLTGWQYLPAYGSKDTSVKGWQYLNAKTGVRKTGWINNTTTKKNVYLNPKTGFLTTGKKTISKKVYDFCETGASPAEGLGVARIGWSDDYSEYYDNKGARVKGWKQIYPDAWYYFDKNGQKLTGWQKIAKKDYYFMQGSSGVPNRYDGMKQYGLVRVDDQGDIDNVSGTLYMLTGRNSNKKTETANGVLAKGWCTYSDGSGKTKYYGATAGTYVTGWRKISNAWYLFRDDGTLHTDKTLKSKDTITSSEGYTALLEGGKLKTGWKDGTVYVTGRQEIDGTYMYLSAKGVPLTGLKTITEGGVKKTFYFSPATGEMMTGDVRISGKWYHFYTAAEAASIGGGVVEGQKR